MALKDVIKQKILHSAGTRLAIWARAGEQTPLAAVEQVAEDMNLKARIYDFARFSPCSSIPCLSLGGEEVLFVNRIDKAPPSFLDALAQLLKNTNGNPAIIISSSGRNSGLPSSAETLFTRIIYNKTT